MHGIWLLVFIPLAAVVGWRYCSNAVRLLAFWLMLTLGAALEGWFGYLTFNGTELANSIYDRVMHSLGVIVGSIDFPLLQFLVATILVVSWPKKWQYDPAVIEVTAIESNEEIECDDDKDS